MGVPQKLLDGLFHGFMENPQRMMVTSHHIPMFPMLPATRGLCWNQVFNLNLT